MYRGGAYDFFAQDGRIIPDADSEEDALARVRRWTEDERAAQLLDLTTDRPFQLLSNVPKQDGCSHYDRLVVELRNAYGLTMDRAITSLFRVRRQKLLVGYGMLDNYVLSRLGK